MKKKDIMLALLVVIVWGANFTVIKLGLDGVPSMLLVSLRYLIVALPAVFFIKRPNLEWKYIVLYGLTVGVGQFSCLFYAMEMGMPASLASIIVQLQAFISPFFAWIFLKEKLKTKQIIGFLVAAVGLFVIGMASGTSGVTKIPIKVFILTIFAPIFWALSNIIVSFVSQKAIANGEKLDMLGLIVWSSLIPPLPVLVFALMLDTPQTLIGAITNLNAISVFAILYLSFGATLFGYGMWSQLIAKHSIGEIAPLSLLVPITGLLTARIVLSEQLSKMQWLGVIIILIGLIITNLDPKVIISFINKHRIKDVKNN
ncbi:MAG: EamA family transporter [Tissierellia bacterium]|nr:EamA family transporter [Tissierellia bacterium]